MSNGIVLPRHRKMLNDAKRQIARSKEIVTITADPNSPLGHICRKVASLEPGQCLDVGIEVLREIPSFSHNGVTFTPADRVLGNIVGSAYTHSFDINPMNGVVTFRRYDNTGERRYKEPDHDIRVARLTALKPSESLSTEKG